MFNPIPGNYAIWTNMFQMAWNHQLVYIHTYVLLCRVLWSLPPVTRTRKKTLNAIHMIFVWNKLIQIEVRRGSVESASLWTCLSQGANSEWMSCWDCEVETWLVLSGWTRASFELQCVWWTWFAWICIGFDTLYQWSCFIVPITIALKDPNEAAGCQLPPQT